jgi:glyoxylase-like metal-dependent hydrolase (beta-lactamase superfamily II)
MSDTILIDDSAQPEVTPFFDTATNTVSYVVKDPSSHGCAVIDAVMDIDYAAGRITYKSADKVVAFITQHVLKYQITYSAGRRPLTIRSLAIYVQRFRAAAEPSD